MSQYYNRQGESMTMFEWAVAFEDKDYKRVALTEFAHLGVEVRVSTVWLGLDHNFGDDPPLIFETMIFGGSLDEDQKRYSTEAEALAGHEAMVQKAHIAFADDAAPPTTSRATGEGE